VDDGEDVVGGLGATAVAVIVEEVDDAVAAEVAEGLGGGGGACLEGFALRCAGRWRH
jgi:hypothetical protein